MMRFDKIIPNDKLRAYIRYFVISENEQESVYKVFPSAGLVIGFQYRGQLKTLEADMETSLKSAGITGIASQYKVFSNSAGIGTILVYFTEVGLAHFSSCPANELFDLSISLEDIFDKQKVRETEEKLAAGSTDQQRIYIVEQFLLSQLRDIHRDRLIMEAVKLIHQTKGNIRIRDLNLILTISQSPFEKRFRRMVGTSPKKFASIVRFNEVLSQLSSSKSLMDICFENDFFDQAHFSKDFKQFTGDSPENFKRFM